MFYENDHSEMQKLNYEIESKLSILKRMISEESKYIQKPIIFSMFTIEKIYYALQYKYNLYKSANDVDEIQQLLNYLNETLDIYETSGFRGYSLVVYFVQDSTLTQKLTFKKFISNLYKEFRASEKSKKKQLIAKAENKKAQD